MMIIDLAICDGAPITLGMGKIPTYVTASFAVRSH